MEFAQACKAVGLRAIHGAELTLDDGRHLTLLVERRARVAQPLPARDARACAHARGRADGLTHAGDVRGRSATGDPGAGAGPAPGARPRQATQPHVPLAAVLDHAEGLVCLSGCADHGVHDRATLTQLRDAFAPDAPARRAAASLPARRPRAQPPARRARARAGPALPSRPATSTPTRARARRCRTRSSRSATTRRSTPPSRCGAATSATCWRRPQAMAARFAADHPDAVAETAELADRLRFDLTEHLGYRYPGAEDADADRTLAELSRAQAATTRYPPGRSRREPAARRGAAAPGGGAAHHRRARPVRLLPAAPRHARAGARGRARGARAGHRPRAAAARPRARLLRLLDRLLPHRPLARRPDRERPVPRALPQRGADRAARHRPRLPARRARGADPAHPRALRQGPLRARRRLPDLPRARRDPRAGQGARAAAGGDRARRARLGGLVGARRRARRRLRARRASASRRAAGPGSRASPTGARPAAPPLPAPGRDGRRDAPAGRLLPDRPGRDGGPPDGPVGQGLLRRRRLPEDRPARARDAVRGRARGRADRRSARRADRPLAHPLRRPADLRRDPERRDDRASSRSRAARRWPRCCARGRERWRTSRSRSRSCGPGRSRAARSTPTSNGCQRLRVDPDFEVPYEHPSLVEPLQGDARHDHLPGPGDRGRDGVRRLLARARRRGCAAR